METIAPPMMIYGWLLQFGYGLFPYLFSRAFLPDAEARLGGNGISLIGVNLGAALILGAALLQPWTAVLSAAAFLAWVISMLPILHQLWGITRAGLARVEQGQSASPLDKPLAFTNESGLQHGPS